MSGVDARSSPLLAALWPEQPWEARNQAGIHTWFRHRFGGGQVAAFNSITEAVATWPETATAVAVRLGDDGTIEVWAPHGLDDLLAGIWRRNPARVSVAESRARLARHQPQQRLARRKRDPTDLNRPATSFPG